MPYIGAGIQKFNTADGLTVSGSTELDGAVVVNESSADADFRVESNGNANMPVSYTHLTLPTTPYV